MSKVLKAFFSSVLALGLLASNVGAAPALRDIQNSWAKGAIEALTDAGIINGYPDGKFRPENPITRAEFCKILVKTLNLSPGGNNPFPDARGHWAEEYIAAIAKAKIVNGYEDGSFRPNNRITRAEVVTEITRALKLGEKTEPADVWLPSFIDVAKNHWAFKPVEISNHLGLLPSQISTRFFPSQKATREEVAYLVNGMRQLKITEGSAVSKDTNASTLTVRPNAGETQLLYVSTDTVILRNNLAADLSKLLEGDKLYIVANSIGDPLLIKAFGIVTKNDVISRVSSMTQGMLTPEDVAQAMKGNWTPISDSMRGAIYNRLLDLGLSASEAEALVMQDWGSLKGEGKQRLAEALANQLSVSPELVEALMERNWEKLETYAQIELTQRVLSRLIQ